MYTIITGEKGNWTNKNKITFVTETVVEILANYAKTYYT